jgi:hypothetical protein
LPGGLFKGYDMAVNQLLPPLPLHVLGKGDGLAVAVIDYGPDYDLLWVTIINETGEIWTANNRNARGVKNWSIGRDISKTPKGLNESGVIDWKVIQSIKNGSFSNAPPAALAETASLKSH